MIFLSCIHIILILNETLWPEFFMRSAFKLRLVNCKICHETIACNQISASKYHQIDVITRWSTKILNWAYDGNILNGIAGKLINFVIVDTVFKSYLKSTFLNF